MTTTRLGPCRTCGEQIARSAKRCPKCGERRPVLKPPRSASADLKTIGIAFAIVVALGTALALTTTKEDWESGKGNGPAPPPVSWRVTPQGTLAIAHGATPGTRLMLSCSPAEVLAVAPEGVDVRAVVAFRVDDEATALGWSKRDGAMGAPYGPIIQALREGRYAEIDVRTRAGIVTMSFPIFGLSQAASGTRNPCGW